MELVKFTKNRMLILNFVSVLGIQNFNSFWGRYQKEWFAIFQLYTWYSVDKNITSWNGPLCMPIVVVFYAYFSENT